jgi:hypothetical protein
VLLLLTIDLILDLPSLDVIKETSTLTFHSSALKIGNATAQCDALKTSQTDTSRTFEDEQERCVLHFATPFPAGSKIELKIAFDGALTGAMMGYYKSRYTVDGKEAIYALTQFEVCYQVSRVVWSSSESHSLPLPAVPSHAGTNLH